MTNHSTETIAGIVLLRVNDRPDWDLDYVADIYSRRYDIPAQDLIDAVKLLEAGLPVVH